MGIFSRRRPTTGSSDEPAPSPDPEQVAYARTLIRPGFVSRAEAVAALRDQFEIDDDDRRPEAAVEAAWRQREAEQQTWREVGDYDRMAAAFARIQQQGVLARMNFACCQNCGIDEIDDERTPLRRPAAGEYPWREWGYTFFHQQDAERLAAEPAALYLSYSGFRAAPHLDPALVQAARDGDTGARDQVRIETDRAVGTIVAAALREHGLTVDWDGDPDERIKVRITEWRKYLPV
jgi:hypothetical protein